MRSSFNALLNKGPEDNFIFTTILLQSASVYMGVAFKDIAVIKMIKGAEMRWRNWQGIAQRGRLITCFAVLL